MAALARRAGSLALSPPMRRSLCGSCILRLQQKSQHTLPYQARQYSSKNKDQNSSDGKNKQPSGKQKDKPPQGFEGLYKKGSPLSKSPGPPPNTKQEKDEEISILPGRVQMTDDEESKLKHVLETMKKGLPESEREKLDRAIQQFRRSGMPEEFREILEKFQAGKPLSSLDIATAVRLTRMSSKILEDETAREAKDSGASSKQGTGSKDKSSFIKQGPILWSGTVKMDWSTILILGFIGYMTFKMAVPGENLKEITWQEFKTTFLDKGLVDKLTVVNSNIVRVDLHRQAVGRLYPESPAQYNNFRYYFSIGSVEAFERRLDAAQEDLGIPSSERIPVQYKGETVWVTALLNFGPTVLLIGMLLWGMRRTGGGGAGGGIFNVGKSRAKRFNHDTDIKIRFKDVAGMEEAKLEIMEFVSFLKDPGQYERLGAKIPRGALLSGPPGTGKTLLAKATAGESKVPFFSISGSEFVEIFVGVGPSRVRDLFQTARKNSPCIIFIDEIDAIGKSRAKSTGFGGNDEREGTLNQILTEMDGFNTSEQVVVLAGTNRPDVLDRALLRPGRFDRQIAIDLPTMAGRKQIFKVHLKKIVTKEEMEHLTGRLSALTPGFSGADISNCVNEAALIAARANAASVTMQHFEQAIERVVGGLEKKSLVLNPEEKRTVAYHEAGHAICGWFFRYADPLLKVSIVPRGQGALGYAQYLPPSESYLMTMQQLMDRMAMALGGRVSEELHFDSVTSGASDDFSKVTRMATAMVTKFGMSRKLGYIYFGDDKTGTGAGAGGEAQFQKPFSEHTAQEIDAEVRRIVEEAYEKCRALLTEKKKEVGLVAEELLRKEVLGRDDLVRLLGQRPWAENPEFTRYFDGAPTPKPKKSAAPPPPPPADVGPAVASAPTDQK